MGKRKSREGKSCDKLVEEGGQEHRFLGSLTITHSSTLGQLTAMSHISLSFYLTGKERVNLYSNMKLLPLFQMSTNWVQPYGKEDLLPPGSLP